MTAGLRIGWLMLVVLTIADTLEYAATAHPVRAFVLAVLVVLLFFLRRTLTEQP